MWASIPVISMTSSRRLTDDDRALANNIGLFFATLIVGFLLAIAFEPASEQLLDVAAQHTEREASAKGQAYVQYAWTNAHLIVIGFGILQLLVAAVYESRAGGGPL